MRPFRADLHVHSVLSPCADELMLPTLVLATALARRIDILGVVDHNSAENAPAFLTAAKDSPVRVLPGIEVTTREEVHVLTLFPTLESLAVWQAEVAAHLPNLPNDERVFGSQLVVGADDDLLRVDERLLLTATSLGLNAVVEIVQRLGGLALPAHVDRPAFGLLGQLGFIPADLKVSAFEVSRNVDPRRASDLDPALATRVVVQSSDAHTLDDVGCVSTTLWLEEATFPELVAACRGERRVEYGHG